MVTIAIIIAAEVIAANLNIHMAAFAIMIIIGKMSRGFIVVTLAHVSVLSAVKAVYAGRMCAGHLRDNRTNDGSAYRFFHKAPHFPKFHATRARGQGGLRLFATYPDTFCSR